MSLCCKSNFKTEISIFHWTCTFDIFIGRETFEAFNRVKKKSEHVKSLLVAERPVRNLHGFGITANFNERQLDIQLFVYHMERAPLSKLTY